MFGWRSPVKKKKIKQDLTTTLYSISSNTTDIPQESINSESKTISSPFLHNEQELNRNNSDEILKCSFHTSSKIFIANDNLMFHKTSVQPTTIRLPRQTTDKTRSSTILQSIDGKYEQKKHDKRLQSRPTRAKSKIRKFFRFGSEKSSTTTNEITENNDDESTSSHTSVNDEYDNRRIISKQKLLLDQQFDSLDIDADGYVSPQDLRSVLKNFSHIPNVDDIVPAIIDRADLDKDSRISRVEFAHYLKKKPSLSKQLNVSKISFGEEFGLAFSIFDRDKNNYITANEIKETMINMGEGITDEQSEEMLRSADTNRDGRISRDEFKTLFSQMVKTEK